MDNHHNEPVVIGTTEFLPGFALAGARNTVLANRENVMAKVREYADAGVIILDGTLTTQLRPAEREELEMSTKPVIITLTKEKTEERLRRAIMSTLGVDLLK